MEISNELVLRRLCPGKRWVQCMKRATIDSGLKLGQQICELLRQFIVRLRDALQDSISRTDVAHTVTKYTSKYAGNATLS